MRSNCSLIISRLRGLTRARAQWLLAMTAMSASLCGAAFGYPQQPNESRVPARSSSASPGAQPTLYFVAQAPQDDSGSGEAVPPARPRKLRPQPAMQELPPPQDGSGDEMMMRRARLRKFMERRAGIDGMPQAGQGFPDPMLHGKGNRMMPEGGGMRRGFFPGGQPGMQGPMGGRFGGAMMRRQGAFGGGFGGRAPLDFSRLNLTEEQKTKIKALREKNADKAKELRQSMMTRRQEMQQMMFDPEASDAAIRAKFNELRRMQEQAEEIKINDFLAIRSLLTPEQKKRLPEVRPAAGGGNIGMRAQNAPPGGPGFDGPPPFARPGEGRPPAAPHNETAGVPPADPAE
ncbi:MAG TPA: Spy/CpxP family protein refolding chaperone [Candidatus Obscuribacterales bacterium]